MKNSVSFCQILSAITWQSGSRVTLSPSDAFLTGAATPSRSRKARGESDIASHGSVQMKAASYTSSHRAFYTAPSSLYNSFALFLYSKQLVMALITQSFRELAILFLRITVILWELYSVSKCLSRSSGGHSQRPYLSVN